MKMNLAVYTAQEGYSWQPGTSFTAEELVAFKKRIGKFPSADSAEFPFGGIFLLDDRVVFYRYHVAKKIDFRGRDALYCVLGAVSREEGAKIDPSALFACPEFAGPMKPFPTELELQEADSSTVPEWLKNLDRNTLDVRITGAADKPSYAVVQEPIEIPQAHAPEPSVTDPSETPSANSGSAEPAPAPDGMAASSLTADKSEIDSSTAVADGRVTRPLPRWMIWWAASLAVVALLLAVVTALLWKKSSMETVANPGIPPPSATAETVAPPGRDDVPPPSAATVGDGTPPLPECQVKESKAK